MKGNDYGCGHMTSWLSFMAGGTSSDYRKLPSAVKERGLCLRANLYLKWLTFKLSHTRDIVTHVCHV